MIRRLLVLLFSILIACNSGGLGTGDADADADSDLDGDADGDEPVDPCATLVCPEGQSCEEGRCRTIDLCEDVICANPGEVCDPRDGSCASGTADEDSDGYSITDGDCDDGNAAVHPGAAEECNGVDDDCDLDVDEGFPDEDGDGFDTCGFGDSTQADCDDSEAMRSPGRDEICDSLDNDCDDSVDEDLEPRTCSTDCGDGEERCEGGSWICDCECTQHLTTTFAELSTHNPACTNNPDLWYSIECFTAYHRFCAARRCLASGYGPVAIDGDEVEVVCFSDADVMATSYTALSAENPRCSGEEGGLVGSGCTIAIHGWCRSEGHMTGFGPFETSGLDTSVTCLGHAVMTHTSFTTLSSHDAACDGDTNVWGPGCFAAVDRFCRADGYLTGFGPTGYRVHDDYAIVQCVDP